MSAFDVTERDMPPATIRALGRASALRAWLALGWLGWVRGHRHGALVLLRK